MVSDNYNSRVAELSKLFGADELDPELEECLFTDGDGFTWIKHPLVFSMFHVPMLNRTANTTLRQKREVLAEYEAESNWHGYILVHERPYRLDALMQLDGRVADAEWWDLVGFVWCDSENIRQFPDVWDVVLRDPRPDRQAIMRDDEREAFAGLPDLIDVYQGCTVDRDDGWSWTTDRARAVWFATRFANMENSRAALRTGRVRKADVTAYFTRRNEAEVLVAPELVH